MGSFPACMCGQHMCTVFTEFRRGSLIPCFKVTDLCEPPYGCWDPDQGPQEELSNALKDWAVSPVLPLNSLLGKSTIKLLYHSDGYLSFGNLVQFNNPTNKYCLNW